MVLTLDDTKRLLIATKLADMKALQNMLINKWLPSSKQLKAF